MNTSLQHDDGTNAAHRLAERAGGRVRDLGFGMKDLAQRGVDSMSESAQAAQRQVSRYASTAGRYVTEQPLKSALIAAAVGAAVAGLIIALRHNRSSHH